MSCGNIYAKDLKLKGLAIPGGLIVGWTRPDSKIFLDKKKIKQGVKGDFLIGFGPDAKTQSNLKVFYKEKLVTEHQFNLVKKFFKIQKINGLPRRKVIPNAYDLKRIKDERALVKIARKKYIPDALFVAGFSLPVEGIITGVYGSKRILNGVPRRPHYGLDIVAKTGTPVKVISDGVVVFTNEDMFFNGKMLIINHGLGLTSMYIHLSKIMVETGDRVLKGQEVGLIGSTGRSTGPHLHLGVMLNKTPLDPEQLFK